MSAILGQVVIELTIEGCSRRPYHRITAATDDRRHSQDYKDGVERAVEEFLEQLVIFEGVAPPPPPPPKLVSLVIREPIRLSFI